ncbi:hypothetical protein [Runella limosa]|uniref:hypothetical protein n=1 Tax=Runella limosa TaxID=370978 RepID=UPI00048B63BE|nr:hypothetical protein [Runella limosa]
MSLKLISVLKLTALFLLLWGISGFVSEVAEPIRYFRPYTLALPVAKTIPYLVDFEEETGTDTLFQAVSQEGCPVSYFRHIQNNVCFDGKCRMLVATLYWNPTGRYLGFELPKGEFLSKTDHDPFTPEEYTRLSEILADSLSPLGTFTYNALVPKAAVDVQKVDAVSSPTAPDVLDYIIKGAAYTTYKLWHLVYGPTQLEIEKLTQKTLSADLLLKILESNDLGDKMWAVRRVRPFISAHILLQQKVISLIQDNQYNLSEQIIRELPTTDSTIQRGLAMAFLKNNYAIKKLIVEKLKMASSLTPEMVALFTSALPSLQGESVASILELLRIKKINDPVTGRAIADLLRSDNNFVARKAYDFLTKQKINDPYIEEQLTRFQSKQK